MKVPSSACRMSDDENRRNGHSESKGHEEKSDEKISLLNDSESGSNKDSLQSQQQSTSNTSSSFRNRGNQRWLKLRTTVQLSNAISSGTSHKKPPLKREDSFLKRFSTRQVVEAQETYDGGLQIGNKQGRKGGSAYANKSFVTTVINPDESFYFVWLTVITCCVLYNYWTVIVRQAFPELQNKWQPMWFTLDGFADAVFILDVVVQFRTGYLEQGLMVYDYKMLALHYMKSRHFVMDLASLTPIDILQAFIGIKPVLRFPRFIKVYRMIHFYYMVESRTLYPNLLRVINLVHVLLLLAHWFGCFYYMLSEAEQFRGEWVYPYPEGDFATLTRKYLGSVYWATLTLTTIGDLPTPASNVQHVQGTTPAQTNSRSRSNFKSRIMYQSTNIGYLFTIISYLIGVFIFATIVGQVGNVITNRNASRLEFERLLDSAKLYMRHHRVPRDMQRRVQRWYDYSWSRGRMRGGGDINSALGHLPDKLKTELALHVNLKTLKKVSIFKECQPEFLHDLVLKMKAYIFTPGDLICRKGEVAREMFIIADGILEVISDTGKVLTQMKAGDFFGEIGILNLDGFNKRTADVRSVGYSELFSLSREDVLAAMKDFPEAQEILLTMGKKRLLEAKLAGNVGNKPDEEVDSNNQISKPPDFQNSSRYRHRSVMKKIKQDVSGIKYYFSKSRDSLNQGAGDFRMEISPISTSEEYGDSSRDSVRGILRKLTKQSTGKIKDYRSSSGGKRYGSSMHDSTSGDCKIRSGNGSPNRSSYNIRSNSSTERAPFTSVEGPSSVDIDNQPNGDDEVIGAGLPLIQRLLLLNKRDNEMAREGQRRKSSEDPGEIEMQETPQAAPMPFIQRLKMLKKKEEETNLKPSAMESVSSVDEPSKVCQTSEEAASTTEVVGAGLPLIQRLKMLKKMEDDKSKEPNKARSEPLPSVSSSETSPQEPVGAGLPLIQRLKLLKKKEDANVKVADTVKKVEKNNDVAERSFSKGLTPEMSCSSLRRLSTLMEQGLGQGSTVDENSSEASVQSAKSSSANTICDRTEDDANSRTLTNKSTSLINESSNQKLAISESNSDISVNVDENWDVENDISPTTANKTLSELENDTVQIKPHSSSDPMSFNSEYLSNMNRESSSSPENEQSVRPTSFGKKGILKSPSSTENSNNEDSIDIKVSPEDSLNGYAERRKRLQKSVAFCCDSPESPKNEISSILRKEDTRKIDQSYDDDDESSPTSDKSVFIQETLKKKPSDQQGLHNDKMVQVISALHSLIKMQMSTIQEKLLNRIQELESEMKRKDAVIESLIMKMRDSETIVPEEDLDEEMVESEDSFVEEFETEEENHSQNKSDKNSNDRLLFRDDWDDPGAFDEASLMRLEFPTMSDSNSLSRGASFESNKSMVDCTYGVDDVRDEGYQTSYLKSSKRGTYKKRNPLLRYQSLSMYPPDTAFTVVDERSAIGASVPELYSPQKKIWDAEHRIEINDRDIP